MTFFEYSCSHCGIAYKSFVPCERQCKNCNRQTLSSTPVKNSSLPWFKEAQKKRSQEIREAVDAYWKRQEHVSICNH